MEPTIYKPGAYKTPGIYNGAGGIYKGRGVYNDGSSYNGPFVLLNNCDTIENNKLISLIGSNGYTSDLSSFGYLVNSSVFIGTKSTKRNNDKYIEFHDIDVDDIFTIEYYFSDLPNGDTDLYGLRCFSISFNMNLGLYIGCEYASDFETTYPVGTWVGIYNAMKLPFSNSGGHIAAVVNKITKRVNVFYNGVKVGSYTYEYLGNSISQNGWGASGILEFICIRNGDFSNNMESFIVPIQKYSL